MGILAQTDDGSGIVWATWFFAYLGFIVLYAIAGWVVYVKAGEKGWKSLIPIYNFYVLLKIVGRPGWWLILLLIPFVNFVIWIIVQLDLAKSFGKGVGFALGLIFLGFIFMLILAFGPAEYQGPAGPEGSSRAAPPMPA